MLYDKKVQNNRDKHMAQAKEIEREKKKVVDSRERKKVDKIVKKKK